jgi:hypothetical protein
MVILSAELVPDMGRAKDKVAQSEPDLAMVT